VPSTHPGLSRTATIALSGAPTRRVGVAILCRVPYADGALTPAFNAQARGASTAAPRPPAVACAARDYLRAAPGAGVIGSIGTGEPLRVLRRRGGWRKVATEFGATGWVPALEPCG
jgi:Bacterial SH3 domain